jgi:hypothetical protein
VRVAVLIMVKEVIVLVMTGSNRSCNDIHYSGK